MSFVLRMAVRETRSAWKRLFFFFICVAIGVAAIVLLRSVIQNVRSVLGNEARTLIGADLTISTNRPWQPDLRQQLESRLRSAPVWGRSESIEIATMVRPADSGRETARIAELRGVGPEFPLYGRVTLEDGRRYSHEMLRNGGALVRRELLAQLGVRVGDALRIGSGTFTIRGVLTAEPGSRLGAFSLGSRVLVDLDALRTTGLLAYGSRARYELGLRVREDAVGPLADELRADFRERFVNVRTFRGTQDAVSEDLTRAEDYLSLIGFVILVLGGIGVWSVTRVFVRQKLRSIAALKCLGATTRQVLTVYLLQIALLGAAASAAGAGLAWIVLRVLPLEGLQVAGRSVTYAVTGAAVVQGASVGVIVSLLFALVPLLDVRRVKPLILLRHEVAQPAAPSFTWSLRSIDWSRVVAVAAVVVVLVGVAGWQAGSLESGGYVAGGFIGVSLILHIVGALLIRVVRPIGRVRSFALRHAVMNVCRPGNQTRLVLLAVGLGTFFIVGTRGIQHNLLRELSLELRPDTPDMFLIDVQQDQTDKLRGYVTRVNPGRHFRLAPVLRARVVGVRGREINLENYEDVRGKGSLGREYVITFRDYLQDNEQVIDGRFWGAQGTDRSGPPDQQAAEVSIEESIKERFGIQTGDTMRFDVLGRVISVRVTSVRQVDWDDPRTGGFMFVFTPAALRGSPHTYIAIAKGPPDAAARARIQAGVVSQFPNVSIVDVREVLQTVASIVNRVTFGVTVVGLVAVLSGILILVGSVAMTRFQRMYEAAILRTLGATTRTLATMLLLEYGVLGAIAGAIGSVAGAVLTWSVTRYLLDIRWSASVMEHATVVLVSAVLVAVTGLAASVEVLRRKPLGTLRAE